MKKNLLSVLLTCALVLGLFTGCQSKDNTSEAASSAPTATAAQAQETATPTPEAEASVEVASVEEPTIEEPTGPEAYYACEELTEITVLFQYAAFFQGFFPEGWNSSQWWTALGEKTNTTYTLREVSNLEWSENVNLLCASGDLPDVVTNIGGVYNGGLSAALRDEMIIDVEPYLQEYAPHYYQALTQDEYTLKTCLTDDGEMGAMYPIVEEPYPITSGLWIRQDWLDELGKEIPTTTGELKTVLELFRDNYGADVGFFQMIRAGASSSEVGFAAEGIWNAFGPCNFFLDKEGKVQFGPMQDYYYDYLAYCKELASEGLLITSDMTDRKANELFASGSIGLEGDMPDNVPSYLALLDPEEAAKAKLVPMTALGEPTEYGPITSYISSDGGGNISISNNCQHPEIVVKAMDYLFTDEGALLSSYGIEGVSYELNAEGKPELTELVLNNPGGIPLRAALGYYCNPGLPGYMDLARSQNSWDEVQKGSYAVWEKAYTGSSQTVDVNALSLTQQEQDAISVYRSDMVTFATEWVNGVVFGTMELTDGTIADFQATMRDTMHIEDILKVYNDAYARFQARSLES